MPLHKKVGILTVALAFLLAAAGLVFSTQICSGESPYFHGQITWLLHCNYLKVLDQEADPLGEYTFNFKYILIGCLTLSVVGLLWFFQVLPHPFAARSSRAPEVE